MSHPTPSDLLVLHTLRCIGTSGMERLADAAGLPQADVDSVLIDLAVDGLVSRSAGAFGGWSVTDDGKQADGERIAAELETSGSRIVVQDAFDVFLGLNPELLELCTAWQMQTVGGVMTLNDHRDAEYDGRVLDRLTDLHGRSGRVLGPLTGTLHRFHRYETRLTDALVRANAGDVDYVADRMDSYHSVWFQLHEDLLVTLGIPRT